MGTVEVPPPNPLPGGGQGSVLSHPKSENFALLPTSPSARLSVRLSVRPSPACLGSTLIPSPPEGPRGMWAGLQHRPEGSQARGRGQEFTSAPQALVGRSY